MKKLVLSLALVGAFGFASAQEAQGNMTAIVQNKEKWKEKKMAKGKD